MKSWTWRFLALLAAAFVVRLFFLPSLGFHNDVSAFEAWTLTLKDNAPWGFYAKTTFADYPPGYFIVLWFIGGVYGLLGQLHVINTNDPSYFALRLLVKLPALAMDLVDVALIYAIVRRYASELVALGAAALFALNPATIYTSAYWGQVDSVSWGGVLLALWLALRSSDQPAKLTARITWAWLAMAFSILIKPQGALVAVVLLAFAFVPADLELRARRIRATAFGLVASLVLVLAVAALFHPSGKPRRPDLVAVRPLPDRQQRLSLQYRQRVQPLRDQAEFLVAGHGAARRVRTLVWADVAVGCRARHCGDRFDRRTIPARTHRPRVPRGRDAGCVRVLHSGDAHARALHFRRVLARIPVARVRAPAGLGRRRALGHDAAQPDLLVRLSNDDGNAPAGRGSYNIWGAPSHLIAAVNVALFFLMGYLYLGGSVSMIDVAEADVARVGSRVRARAWFDPREGIAAMTRRDWLYAGLFTVASLVLCLILVRWPSEKIFDEIYYARAGEEYLKHMEIFEFTHPPLTKLVVTLSMMLFGGLHGLGDTALGWRFLNVVVGALMVGVLYVFAKRLSGSTLFAAIATGMLLFDGFHYVQARIATPEITVAFFSLTTLYAFYRVWTASAARRELVPPFNGSSIWIVVAFLFVGALAGVGIATILINFGPHTRGPELRPGSVGDGVPLRGGRVLPRRALGAGAAGRRAQHCIVRRRHARRVRRAGCGCRCFRQPATWSRPRAI